MPVLNITTSASVLVLARADALVHELSRMVARELQKPATHLFGFDSETFA